MRSRRRPSTCPRCSRPAATAADLGLAGDLDGRKPASRQRAEKAEGLAEKLAEAAESGDAKATLAAFATLGKEGCGGCHGTFRKKDS